MLVSAAEAERSSMNGRTAAVSTAVDLDFFIVYYLESLYYQVPVIRLTTAEGELLTLMAAEAAVL